MSDVFAAISGGFNFINDLIWKQEEMFQNSKINESNIKNQAAMNAANIQNQQFINAQNQSLTREGWAREDNAIQRRAADLKAAGLNPLLAVGQAAQSSQAIPASASADQRAATSRALSNRAPPRLSIDPMVFSNIKIAEAQTRKLNAEADALDRSNRIGAAGEDAATNIAMRAEEEFNAKLSGMEASARSQFASAALNELAYDIGSATKEDQIEMAKVQRLNAELENELLANQVKWADIKASNQDQYERARNLEATIKAKWQRALEEMGINPTAQAALIQDYALKSAQLNYRTHEISGVPTDRQTTEDERFLIAVLHRMEAKDITPRVIQYWYNNLWLNKNRGYDYSAPGWITPAR